MSLVLGHDREIDIVRHLESALLLTMLVDLHQEAQQEIDFATEQTETGIEEAVMIRKDIEETTLDLRGADVTVTASEDAILLVAQVVEVAVGAHFQTNLLDATDQVKRS